MATIVHTEPSLEGVNSRAKAFTWGPLIAGSLVGDAANVSNAGLSLTLDASGTWASATLTIRGSNKPAPDPTVAADWFTLKNQLGTAATLTADGGLSLSDLPLWISPIIAGGGGTESITVRLIAR